MKLNEITEAPEKTEEDDEQDYSLEEDISEAIDLLQEVHSLMESLVKTLDDKGNRKLTSKQIKRIDKIEKDVTEFLDQYEST